jgi:hypothetical protein
MGIRACLRDPATEDGECSRPNSGNVTTPGHHCRPLSRPQKADAGDPIG